MPRLFGVEGNSPLTNRPCYRSDRLLVRKVRVNPSFTQNYYNKQITLCKLGRHMRTANFKDHV